MSKDGNPLLLLDNSTMYVLGKGTYKIDPMTFAEAKSIIEIFGEEDVLRCYSDSAIDKVIHDYVGVEDRNFPRKKIARMRAGQQAIAFKQYIAPSETQPIIDLDPGAQAQKIQNVYIYCEFITRMA